jgi:uncharacterized membrane protein YdjX (TVP38/TMEM64 family)
MTLTQRGAVRLVVLACVVSIAGALWLAIGGQGAIGRWLKASSVLVADNFVLAVAMFGVVAFLLQLLFVPTGTLLNLVGGYLLGIPATVAAYTVAQLLAAPVVHTAVRRGFGAYATRQIETRMRARWARFFAIARDEGVFAVVIMRLTPVFTSAVTPALSALLGISLGTLLLGTLFAAWARPLVVSSFGAAVRRVQEVDDVGQIAQAMQGWTLLIPIAAAAGLVLVRVIIRRRLAARQSKSSETSLSSPAG